jgi:hypothetical protein
MKFEVPGSRVSGRRSPLVSTTAEPNGFKTLPSGKVHGMGFPGNLTSP